MRVNQKLFNICSPHDSLLVYRLALIALPDLDRAVRAARNVAGIASEPHPVTLRGRRATAAIAARTFVAGSFARLEDFSVLGDCPAGPRG
jgi:hypothetical protein